MAVSAPPSRTSLRVDIRGKSGASYSFVRLDGGAPLRRMGVTYVIAAQAEAGWRVLDVGQTNDLSDEIWRTALERARGREPRAECLIRLNVSRRVREAELDDIAALFRG